MAKSYGLLKKTSSNSTQSQTRQSRRCAENPRDTPVLRGGGPQGHFFEKTKNPFLDMVEGRASTKFPVRIVFRLARSSRPWILKIHLKFDNDCWFHGFSWFAFGSLDPSQLQIWLFMKFFYP